MPINKTICPKCADDSLTVDNNKINCCYCTTPMIITELTTAEFRTDEPKYTKLIFDEYVKDNPLYDPEMHKQREITYAENRKRVEEQRNGFVTSSPMSLRSKLSPDVLA